MNLLVCISKTPETTAKINFTDGGKAFDSDGVNYIMNPYDEWYALVRAVELKEQNGGEVTVLHVGDSSSDIIIRKALSIGGDKAVRVDADPKDSFFVATQIAEYCKNNPQDVIFFGKETIDYNGAEVGSMVSEMLDLPYVSFASKLEKNGDAFTVERDIEGGVQVVELAAPFGISAAKGLAEQRIPNMKSIMMSKRKPVEVVAATDTESKVEIVHYETPPPKSGVKLFEMDNLEELVKILRDEEKVI